MTGERVHPKSAGQHLAAVGGRHPAFGFRRMVLHRKYGGSRDANRNLRYHFEIANQNTDATLWVGSHCILQFDVAVLENGRRLSPEQAKRHLAKLTQLMQLNSCIRALEQLAAKKNNPILSGALDYYRRNKKLTPKYAAVGFWKLQAFRIDHHPSFFQVELRRDQHIEDLRAMPTRRVHRFWGALPVA